MGPDDWLQKGDFSMIMYFAHPVTKKYFERYVKCLYENTKKEKLKCYRSRGKKHFSGNKKMRSFKELGV